MVLEDLTIEELRRECGRRDIPYRMDSRAAKLRDLIERAKMAGKKRTRDIFEMISSPKAGPAQTARSKQPTESSTPGGSVVHNEWPDLDDIAYTLEPPDTSHELSFAMRDAGVQPQKRRAQQPTTWEVLRAPERDRDITAIEDSQFTAFETARSSKVEAARPVVADEPSAVDWSLELASDSTEPVPDTISMRTRSSKAKAGKDAIAMRTRSSKAKAAKSAIHDEHAGSASGSEWEHTGSESESEGEYAFSELESEGEYASSELESEGEHAVSEPKSQWKPPTSGRLQGSASSFSLNDKSSRSSPDSKESTITEAKEPAAASSLGDTLSAIPRFTTGTSPFPFIVTGPESARVPDSSLQIPLHRRKPWEQAVFFAERTSWFDERDIAILKIMDRKGSGTDAIAKELKKVSPLFVRSPINPGKVLNRVSMITASLSNTANLVKTQITVPDPSWNDTTIHLKFHDIIVASDWWQLPSESPLKSDVLKHGRGSSKQSCLQARLDCFYDLFLRSYANDKAFMMLRQIEPRLVVWSLEQSILDTNPFLRDPNHPLRKCVGGIFSAERRAHVFAAGATRASNHKPDKGFRVWCRFHKRFENWHLAPALWWKMSLGLINFHDFVEVAFESSQKLLQARRMEASHLCGNHWCEGLFCAGYEPGMLNLQRSQCHARADKDPDAECSCWPGIITGTKCLLAQRRIEPYQAQAELTQLIEAAKDKQFSCTVPGCGYAYRPGVNRVLDQVIKVKISQCDPNQSQYDIRSAVAMRHHLTTAHHYDRNDRRMSIY